MLAFWGKITGIAALEKELLPMKNGKIGAGGQQSIAADGSFNTDDQTGEADGTLAVVTTSPGWLGLGRTRPFDGGLAFLWGISRQTRSGILSAILRGIGEVEEENHKKRWPQDKEQRFWESIQVPNNDGVGFHSMSALVSKKVRA
jgi:hypothetical protein